MNPGFDDMARVWENQSLFEVIKMSDCKISLKNVSNLQFFNFWKRRNTANEIVKEHDSTDYISRIKI